MNTEYVMLVAYNKNYIQGQVRAPKLKDYDGTKINVLDEDVLIKPALFIRAKE